MKRVRRSANIVRAFCLLASVLPLFLSSSGKSPAAASTFSGSSKVSDTYPRGFYQDDPLPNKVAYLTFDDGPSDWTSSILDILDKEDVKATFFLCGNWAPKSDREHNDFSKYRDVLIRMIKGKHAIGNHTVDHKNLARLSPDLIARQFDENQELLNKALGPDSVQMTLLRPPFGGPWHDNQAEPVLAKVGKVIRPRGVMVLWSRHFDSSDSQEWVRGEWYEKGPRIYAGDAQFKGKMLRIYNRLISRATGSGMVILFHDTHPTSLEILPSVIEQLKKKGYRFETMEDYVRWRWGKSSAELISGN